MNTLFPIEPSYPPGFFYDPEFISPEEEAALLEKIGEIKLHAFNFHGYEAKRNVASYGAGWSFTSKALTEGHAIPSFFQPLIQKVAAKLSIPPQDFAQLLVTEYPAGSLINWHRDAPPYKIISGVSLLSDCTFRLRPYHKTITGKKPILSFPVRRRSLYIIQGISRTDWEHSTAPVPSLRYSITLRTLK